MSLTPEQKQMVEENIHYAYYMAGRLCKTTPLEYEDILSICFKSLVRDANFDSSKSNVKLSTYVCTNMEHRVYNEVKRKYKPAESLELVGHGIGVEYCIDDVLDKRKAIQLTLQFFDGSQREKAAVITFVRNPHLTQMEIADKAGVCQKTVSTGIARLRKQLQEKLAG